MFRLDGRVAVVTGATRGIGWACAQLLAGQGATVLISGVSSREAVDRRVAELRQQHGGAHEGALFDVADPDAVRAFYQGAFQTHRRLDVLVNNAGVLRDSLLGMVSEEAIDRTFAVNVKGMILNMQYASRLMSRGGGGSIVNMSSIIGRVGNTGQVVYGGSKAAVIGITLSAAKELAAQKIRVNAVAPGFIDTDMIDAVPEEKRAERIAGIRMGRVGTGEDVARVVYFLASDLAAYVTGQVIGVDGGMAV